MKPRFAAHAHTANPTYKIHSADCSKSITPQPKYCSAEPLTADTLAGAVAEMRASLDKIGRDDIIVTVCPCARAAAKAGSVTA